MTTTAAALTRAHAAPETEAPKVIPISVIVGDTRLTAKLDDTPTARDFLSLLPLELSLSDYHGIEKVADLPRSLDTSEAPDTYKPEPGDITTYAPWGNLAIFYKPFSASRGLVRLGEFDGSIEPLLGSSQVPVRIEANPRNPSNAVPAKGDTP